MQQISDNQFDFALRMQRIEATAKAQTQRLFVGEDECYVLPRAVRKIRKSGLAEMLGNLLYPLSMFVAPLLGVLSHGVGMLLRYQVMGLKGWSDNPDIEMVAQVILGFSLAMVMGYLIGLRSNRLTSLKALGVLFGLLCFHNAVHMYPEVFTRLTSSLWVSQMMAATKAHSVMWRGVCLVF